MRAELIAWVVVHSVGVAIALVGLVLSLNLVARPGKQVWPLLRGLSSLCAMLIHGASIIVGTAVVANLSAGYVWGYAIFQGGMFLIISGVNAAASAWEYRR